MSEYQTYLQDCNCKEKGVLLHNGEICCRWCRTPYGKGGVMNYLEEHFPSPVKVPLFLTSDNVPVYEGDEIWMVFTAPGGIGNPGITKARKELLPLKSYQKTFSTKEAVYEWLLLNKPCLSIDDVIKVTEWYSGANTHEFRRFKLSDLKELAKQKLSQ